jgi:hypothetical protein
MVDFGFTVTGERKTQIRFDQFPQKAHDTLLRRITALTSQLEARVKMAAPAGTGKLRGAIVQHVYDERVDRIRGRVTFSGDYAKAAALEYGAHNRTSVAAHPMNLDHVFLRRLQAPISVTVAAHSRTPNITAHRFLRDPMGAMQAQIAAELHQAVEEAVGKNV